jgi:hypothetical protein
MYAEEPPAKITRLDDKNLEMIRDIVEKRCYNDDNCKPLFEHYMQRLEAINVFTRYDWLHQTTAEFRNTFPYIFRNDIGSPITGCFTVEEIVNIVNDFYMNASFTEKAPEDDSELAFPLIGRSIVGKKIYKHIKTKLADLNNPQVQNEGPLDTSIMLIESGKGTGKTRVLKEFKNIVQCSQGDELDSYLKNSSIITVKYEEPIDWEEENKVVHFFWVRVLHSMMSEYATVDSSMIVDRFRDKELTAEAVLSAIVILLNCSYVHINVDDFHYLIKKKGYYAKEYPLENVIESARSAFGRVYSADGKEQVLYTLLFAGRMHVDEPSAIDDLGYLDMIELPMFTPDNMLELTSKLVEAEYILKQVVSPQIMRYVSSICFTPLMAVVFFNRLMLDEADTTYEDIVKDLKQEFAIRSLGHKAMFGIIRRYMLQKRVKSNDLKVMANLPTLIHHGIVQTVWTGNGTFLLEIPHVWLYQWLQNTSLLKYTGMNSLLGAVTALKDFKGQESFHDFCTLYRHAYLQLVSYTREQKLTKRQEELKRELKHYRSDPDKVSALNDKIFKYHQGVTVGELYPNAQHCTILESDPIMSATEFKKLQSEAIQDLQDSLEELPLFCIANNVPNKYGEDMDLVIKNSRRTILEKCIYSHSELYEAVMTSEEINQLCDQWQDAQPIVVFVTNRPVEDYPLIFGEVAIIHRDNLLENFGSTLGTFLYNLGRIPINIVTADNLTAFAPFLSQEDVHAIIENQPNYDCNDDVAQFVSEETQAQEEYQLLEYLAYY